MSIGTESSGRGEPIAVDCCEDDVRVLEKKDWEEEREVSVDLVVSVDFEES